MARNSDAQNKNFQSTLTDVVWRFQVYGQYHRKRAEALRALAKRTTGQSFKFLQEQFELHQKLLIATIDIVEHTPKSPKPNQRYSEYSDVDAELVLRQLRSAFPEQPDEFLNTYLGIVIGWFYLR